MKTMLWGWIAIMALIALIDAKLGETAEYLNAYEIFRRSLAPWLPSGSDRFLWAQARLGRFALVLGWLAWGIEAALAQRLVLWAGGVVTWIVRIVG